MFFNSPPPLSQARMNELYTCTADGMLAFRLQLLIKILILGFGFSFAMPVLGHMRTYTILALLHYASG
jgi:hypothetical protein